MDSAFISKLVENQTKRWPRIAKTDLITCLGNYMWLWFRIEGNTLRLLSHQGEFQDRNEETAAFINEVLKLHTVKDCEFIVTIDEISFTPNAPLFIVGKSAESRNFLIPDFTFYNHLRANTPRWDIWLEHMLSLDLSHKECSQIFFAGDSNLSRDKYLKLNDPRFKFWFTKMQTNEARVEVLPNGTKRTFSSSSTPFITWEDTAKYKYLLQLEGRDGNAHSGRMKYIMACDSVVISEPLIHREFWYDLLQPGVNYIEFNGAVDDMLNKYDYYQANPKEYKKIQESGRQTIKELTYEDTLKYYALLLNKYADLF